jgi:DNA polymerase-4
MGPHYGRLGRGGGYATVDDTPWVPRAHGRETTYQRDLVGRAEVDEAIHDLAAQVVEDIGREGRPCARVHLKVRFAPFFTVQRSRKLSEPTYDADVIARTALELFERLDDQRPVRLLGVRAEMIPPPEDH